MIEGRCPKCGYCFVGWALRFPRNQMCSNCGAALEIYQDGTRISEGYSPFTAEKHTVNLPTSSSPAVKTEKSGKTEDKHVCFYCQGQGDLMVLHKGRAICLDCLAMKYPGLASDLASYLVKSKDVLAR